MKYFLNAMLILAFAQGGCTKSSGRDPNNTPDMAISTGGFDMEGPDLYEPPLNPYDGPPPVFDTDGGGLTTHDPATCDEAAMLKSYIGCDYWPTMTYNTVWSVFDFAVVVSNPGMAPANVTVSGGGLTANKTTVVMPGTLVKIGLPWVKALKGNDASSTGSSQPVTQSVLAEKGAYHLVSDVPVLVYQFNALQYKGGTGQNLNGDNWSTCPGSASGVGCFSFSNDASLLLPSTAMTPNYVVTGLHGAGFKQGGTTTPTSGGVFAVTAPSDATVVTIKLGSNGAEIAASMDGKVTAATAPATVMYTLNAGDVLQIVGGKGPTKDLSGTQIQGSKPIQVVAGYPCATNPQINESSGGFPKYTCDHVEETVLPIETWGKKYVVTKPTGPKTGVDPGHTVRLYAGLKAVALTYTPAVTGAPAMLTAGQVVEIDTNADFVVEGDNEFAVGSLQKSGQITDPVPGGFAGIGYRSKGDPSLSMMTTVEQWRDKYLFLAPTDYDLNFADVVVQMGTPLTLDGSPVMLNATPIGGGYGVVRIPLGPGIQGAHVLSAPTTFGIQVLGYGAYTSYQYPGGLDLKVITAPPPPIS